MPHAASPPSRTCPLVLAVPRWRARRCYLALALVVASVLGGRPTDAEAQNVMAVAPPPTGRVIQPLDTAERSWLKRIDDRFNSAVEVMAKVLFYPLWATERQYVQFAQQDVYFRPEGSDEPLMAMRPDNPRPSLTVAEVRALQALDQIEVGSDKRAIQRGILEGERVEYVVVLGDRQKYVWHDGKFRKQLPRLEKLADDSMASTPGMVLTKDEVQAAAARGLLAVNTAKLAAGDPQPYLQTERVGGIPVVVLWLAAGAVIFTIYMRGYNFWGFLHALRVIRGKYDDPNAPGEVTHFQALSSALSATVGLGNIAGVTIAMTTGGPGAFFWMMCCGFFGMTSKFTECTLGVKYRRVNPDGTVLGGPMQYLYLGLKERGLAPLGLVLSLMFTVMCILASFGGGNMFQANQSGQQVLMMVQMSDHEKLLELNHQIREAAAAEDYEELDRLFVARSDLQAKMEKTSARFLPVFGVILAAMVGVVIIGGIKRIGAAASRLVPAMCLLYLAGCLFIIFRHFGQVPELVTLIFTEAFSPKAFGGGMLGVLVIGVQRAAFSNEAGVGSAAIAHSAARTDEPVREGTVALLEPFIDTIVVCSLTALVVLITGAWQNEQWIVEQKLAGAALTTKAFDQELPGFSYVLSIAVVLFAYSTLISWSYYGERCWVRLFGERSVPVYRTLYIIAAFNGAIVNLGAVLDFSDMMILTMAFPNVLGLLILAPSVRRDLLDYWRRMKAEGTF